MLQKGQRLTEKALEPIKYQFMDDEQKKKYDLLQEQKALYKAEMKKKQAFEEKMKQ